MPTVTSQIAASADDAITYPTGMFETTRHSAWIGNDGNWNHVGLRFALNVPKGAVVTEAIITFTANINKANDTVRLKIHYEDANDPADFSGDNYASFEARVRSSTAYDWDFTANWTAESEYDTANFATVIQALIDESYWATGEHVVIFVDDDGSTTNAYRQAYSYDGDADKAPVLKITYSIPKGFTSIF